MRMDFTVDATVFEVPEDLRLEKIVAVLVERIRCGDQWRQPMRRVLHPAPLAALETWIAFFSERVLDAELIERTSQPITTVDLVHASAGIELFRDLGEHGIALAEQKVARLLRRGDVNANAAPTHPVHHR